MAFLHDNHLLSLSRWPWFVKECPGGTSSSMGADRMVMARNIESLRRVYGSARAGLRAGRLCHASTEAVCTR